MQFLDILLKTVKPWYIKSDRSRNVQNDRWDLPYVHLHQKLLDDCMVVKVIYVTGVFF